MRDEEIPEDTGHMGEQGEADIDRRDRSEVRPKRFVLSEPSAAALADLSSRIADQVSTKVQHRPDRWYFVTSIGVIGLLLAIGAYFTNATVGDVRVAAANSEALTRDSATLFDAFHARVANQMVSELDKLLSDFSLSLLNSEEKRILSNLEGDFSRLSNISNETITSEESAMTKFLHEIANGLSVLSSINEDSSASEKQEVLSAASVIWEKMLTRDLPETAKHKTFVTDFRVRAPLIRSVIEIKFYEIAPLEQSDHLQEATRYLSIAEKANPNVAQIYNYFGIVAYYKAIQESRTCIELSERLVAERRLYRKALRKKATSTHFASIANNIADSYMTEAKCRTKAKEPEIALDLLNNADRWIGLALGKAAEGVAYVTAAQIKCELIRSEPPQSSMDKSYIYNEVLTLLARAVHVEEYLRYSHRCLDDLLKEKNFGVLGGLGQKDWEEELKDALKLKC